MLSKILLALHTVIHLKSDGISISKWPFKKNKKINYRAKFGVRVIFEYKNVYKTMNSIDPGNFVLLDLILSNLG